MFIGITIGLIIGITIAIVFEFYFKSLPSPLAEKTLITLSSVKKNENKQKNFDLNKMLQGKIDDQLTALDKVPESTLDNIQCKFDSLPPPKSVEMTPPSSGAMENDFAPVQQKKFTIINESINNNILPRLADSKLKSSSASDANILEKQDNPNIVYLLQVGSYKTEADAEQQRVCLGFQGFESMISKFVVSSVVYYRVRIGPFLNFDEMNLTRHKLLELGFDATVISLLRK
ncbi:MAG: SPOR domain-containing protein [Burkholderia sp.]|nr:SPOR domain-containing protein [Burkholderia sp.]